MYSPWWPYELSVCLDPACMQTVSQLWSFKLNTLYRISKLTSILNTTISPARIGAFPMYRNKMSPWIKNIFHRLAPFAFIEASTECTLQTILFETQVPYCLKEPPPRVTRYQCSISDLSTLSEQKRQSYLEYHGLSSEKNHGKIEVFPYICRWWKQIHIPHWVWDDVQ